MSFRVDAAMTEAAEAEVSKRLLLALIAELEMAGVIDGPSFTAKLRNLSEDLNFQQPHLQETKDRLLLVAQKLDDAREHRRAGH